MLAMPPLPRTVPAMARAAEARPCPQRRPRHLHIAHARLLLFGRRHEARDWPLRVTNNGSLTWIEHSASQSAQPSLWGDRDCATFFGPIAVGLDRGRDMPWLGPKNALGAKLVGDNPLPLIACPVRCRRSQPCRPASSGSKYLQ
jgi:hypothetical protein